jgi:hypothetical protein
MIRPSKKLVRALIYKCRSSSLLRTEHVRETVVKAYVLNINIVRN